MKRRSYQDVMTVFVTAIFSLLLTSCFNPVFDSKGSIGGGGSAAEPSTNSSKSVTNFDRNSNIAQTIALDSTDEELAGTAITFPPGALNISTSITVEKAAALDATMLQNIGLTDTGIANAGAGVIIRPAENTEAVNAFNIQLPLPSSTKLRLADNLDNMVVLFHVWKNSENTLVGGVLPLSELSMSGGFVSFDTKYFGAYQVTILTKKVEEKKEVVTTEPIRNANNVSVVNTSGLVKEETIEAHESLPNVIWEGVRLRLDGATRKLYIDGVANTNGVAIKSCKLTLSDVRDIGNDPLRLDLKGMKAEVMVTFLSAITAYGQMACIDAYDRLTTSAWSDGLKVPAVATAANGAAGRKVQLVAKPIFPVANQECRAMVSERGDMTNPIFSPPLAALEWTFVATNPNPHTIYGRFVCGQGDRATHSLVSNGISLPAGTGAANTTVFNIGPPMVYFTNGQTFVFNPVNGTPPYTWELWEGTMLNPALTSTCGTFTNLGNTASFTAGDHVHPNTFVKVIDTNGKVAQTGIAYQTPPSMNIATSLNLRPKQSYQVMVTDGVPPFTPIKTGSGNIASTSDPRVWQFTASNLPNQNTTLHFQDVKGQSTPPGNIFTYGDGMIDHLYGPSAPGGNAYFNAPDAMNGLEMKRLAFTSTKEIFAAGRAIRTGTGYWDYFAVSKIARTGLSTSWGNGGGQSRNINGQEGRSEHAEDPVVYPDNSVALVGTAMGIADYDITVAKYRSDGNVDTTFSPSGFVQHEIIGEDEARAATYANIGGVPKILVGGVDGSGNGYVMMLEADDGSLDSAFGPGGFKLIPGMQAVNDVIFDNTNSRIIVAGKNSSGYFAYAALTTAGALVGSVIAQGQGEAFQVKRHNDGGYVFVGLRNGAPSDRWLIVKTDNALNLHLGFGGTGIVERDWEASFVDVAYAVAVQPDGKIVVGGSQRENDPSLGVARITRFMPDGSDDGSFNGGSFTYQPCCSGQAWRFTDVLIDDMNNFPRIIALANNFGASPSHAIGIIITTPAP